MSARLDALERRIEEIGPSIIRAIEERFGGRQLNNPETRKRVPEHSATSRSTTVAEKQPTPPPRKQEEEEWKVAASKGARRKEAKEEDGNRRRGNGEKRGKGCGSTTHGTAAKATTPGKDDGSARCSSSSREI